MCVWHSPHDPAPILHKPPLKPVARRRRIDQRVEEDGPIPIGQDDHLVLCNRPPCGGGEGCHAVCQLAPLKQRSPFDQSLRGLIDTEAKPLLSKSPIGFAVVAMSYLLQKCTSDSRTFQDAIAEYLRPADDIELYNQIRTHRPLGKDAPVSRPIQRTGSIKSFAILGGLHHHYVRV